MADGAANDRGELQIDLSVLPIGQILPNFVMSFKLGEVGYRCLDSSDIKSTREAVCQATIFEPASQMMEGEVSMAQAIHSKDEEIDLSLPSTYIEVIKLLGYKTLLGNPVSLPLQRIFASDGEVNLDQNYVGEGVRCDGLQSKANDPKSAEVPQSDKNVLKDDSFESNHNYIEKGVRCDEGEIDLQVDAKELRLAEVLEDDKNGALEQSRYPLVHVTQFSVELAKLSEEPILLWHLLNIKTLIAETLAYYDYEEAAQLLAQFALIDLEKSKPTLKGDLDEATDVVIKNLEETLERDLNDLNDKYSSDDQADFLEILRNDTEKRFKRDLKALGSGLDPNIFEAEINRPFALCMTAIRSLEKHRNPVATQVLQCLAQSHPNLEIRCAAIDALGFHMHAEGMPQFLALILEDSKENIAVRVAALETLALVIDTNEDVLLFMDRFLNDPHSPLFPTAITIFGVRNPNHRDQISKAITSDKLLKLIEGQSTLQVGRQVIVNHYLDRTKGALSNPTEMVMLLTDLLEGPEAISLGCFRAVNTDKALSMLRPQLATGLLELASDLHASQDLKLAIIKGLRHFGCQMVVEYLDGLIDPAKPDALISKEAQEALDSFPVLDVSRSRNNIKMERQKAAQESALRRIKDLLGNLLKDTPPVPMPEPYGAKYAAE